MPERSLEPDDVRRAVAFAGNVTLAARMLGCTRQALHAREDLRRAMQEGLAAYRAAQPPPVETVVDAVRLPRADALALTETARAAKVDRQDHLGRHIAGLARLPKPVPGDWAHGDMMVRVRLPADRQRVLRERYGDEYPGRIRAALLALAKGPKKSLDGRRNAVILGHMKEATMFTPIVTAQSAGKIVALIDIAHAFDLDAARIAGVNVERLLVSQPDTMPQAAEIAETLARSGAVELLVVLGTMSLRPLVRVRECAARTGTEVLTIAAERAPAPVNVHAELGKVVAEARRIDRLAAKYGTSRAQHTAERADALLASDVTKPAHYGLSWGVSTGRFSSEMGEALRTMPPATLAKEAARIAGQHGRAAVRDVYQAWRKVLSVPA